MEVTIRKIKPLVERILKDHPKARDNDRLLQLKVWAVQYPKLRDPATSIKEFTDRFLNGTFCDSESIRRSRQKIQEQNPKLRGKRYKGRQIASENIRQSIINM